MGKKARQTFKGDPFLPEILFVQLGAIEYSKDYKKLKDYAERFLLLYPGYRMIESVEERYKKALDSLKEQQIEQTGARWEYSENIGRCGIVTLGIRDTLGKHLIFYSADFIISSTDGKQYKIEKNFIEPDEFAKVSFPSDFRLRDPQSGNYSWECIVEGKTVSNQNIFLNLDQNLPGLSSPRFSCGFAFSTFCGGAVSSTSARRPSPRKRKTGPRGLMDTSSFMFSGA